MSTQPDQAADRRQTFVELQRSTFDLFIVLISLSSAALIWLANIRERSSPAEVVIVWLLVEAVCAIGWLLRKKQLQTAIYTAMIGLWLCNALAATAFHLPLFLYLFALVTLAASVLTGRVASILFSAASTAFILSGERTLDMLTLPPILMIWFTLFTSFIAFRSLSQSLDMAWSYQRYAIGQMSEAREHRARLMQLTKTLSEVRQDLERANAQLVYAQRAAEETRRLKAQFAANVSHELRTPINLIVGFSETIVVSPESYGVPMPPVYWSDMNTIYRSARHLQSLINDVLDVSQIEAGKMAVIKEEVSPAQVISEAANLQREYIESRGLTFNLSIPDDLPLTYLDRTRIRQVILNLLSNAARFTDNGTITLLAGVKDAALWVAVSDTGIGIPSEDLQTIFEEFHQVEGSLSRRWGGSGLGLTLSKQFVELHGGHIWAESAGIPGKGTIFTFTLPLLDQTNVPRSSWDEPFRSPDDSTRYFVVLDKDPAIRQLFERYSVKHRPISIADDTEALRLIQTIRPAALIFDDQIDHAALLNDLQACDDPTPLIACAMPSGRRRAELINSTTHFIRLVTGDALRSTIETLSPAARTVLVIAEDRDVVRMFTRMLQVLPYKILKAYSDEEGLALIHERHPDVIVLDVLRPDADGMTLVRRVRANPQFANTPIIVSSTSGDLDELTPAPHGKIEISKVSGFQPVELVRCIEALVDAFRPASVPARPEIPIG